MAHSQNVNHGHRMTVTRIRRRKTFKKLRASPECTCQLHSRKIESNQNETQSDTHCHCEHLRKRYKFEIYI